jgi:hypothetical protein
MYMQVTTLVYADLNHFLDVRPLFVKKYEQSYHPVMHTPRIYLLCALLFLKSYCTEEANHAMTGLDEKTFRHWSSLYIRLLATELDEVFLFIICYMFN